MGELGGGFFLWLLDMCGNDLTALGSEVLTLSGSCMLLERNNQLGCPGSLPKGLPGPVTALLQPASAQPQWQPLRGAAHVTAEAAKVYGDQQRAPDPIELELEGAAVSCCVGAGN